MIGALDHRDFDVGVGRLREAPHRRATQGKLLGAAAFGGPEDAQGWTTGVCGMGAHAIAIVDMETLDERARAPGRAKRQARTQRDLGLFRRALRLRLSVGALERLAVEGKEPLVVILTRRDRHHGDHVRELRGGLRIHGPYHAATVATEGHRRVSRGA